MKKIDAHAHIGEIGGWANVAATPQQLLELMDMYEIEKTVICSQNNEAVYRAISEWPDRFAGAVYVNPLKENCTQLLKQYLEKGFQAVKLNPLRHAFVADDVCVDPVMEMASTIRFLSVFTADIHPTPFPGVLRSRRALSQCQGDDDSYGTRTRCVYRRKPENGSSLCESVSGNERYADAYKNQRGIRECRCRSYPVRH